VRPAPSTRTRRGCCYAITEAEETPFYAALAVELAGGSHPAGRALTEVPWDDWARLDRAAPVVAAAAGRGGRGRKTRGNEWSTRWLRWVAEEAGVGETGGGVGGRHGVEGGRGVEHREGGRHERQRSAIHRFVSISGPLPQRLWQEGGSYVCWSTPKEVWLTSSAEVLFATCDELCRSSSVLLLVSSLQGLGHAISRRAWRPSSATFRVASLHGLCRQGPAVLR